MFHDGATRFTARINSFRNTASSSTNKTDNSSGSVPDGGGGGGCGAGGGIGAGGGGGVVDAPTSVVGPNDGAEAERE